MFENHPITLSEEQINRWLDDEATSLSEQFQEAARIGADQELEACCEWIQTYHNSLLAADLSGIRRPKPPRLKEQALAALQEAACMADDIPPQGICSDQIDTIRRALEALPND
jgi:hypothetical protein